MSEMEASTPLRWKLPLFLYLATWLSTTGFRMNNGVLEHFYLSLMLTWLDFPLAMQAWQELGVFLLLGLQFSVPLMIILTCHELGHYFTTRRYGVPCSLPYFLPMPFGQFGTLGAVISMDDRIPNRRALLDIGISGPLAGLVPTFIFLYLGIHWSFLGPTVSEDRLAFGSPLLIGYVTHWIYGPLPMDVVLNQHPVADAAWVGLFLTTLNLMPIGQLDGGHIFYAILGRRAKYFSLVFFYFVIVFVAFHWSTHWYWSLILVLLSLMGVSHPPTADDNAPLTPLRYLLGWAILAFIFIGFTPSPIVLDDPQSKPKPQRFYCQTRETESVTPSAPVLTFSHDGV